MVVELNANSLTFRIKNPNMFTLFRTHDIGKHGRLYRIVGLSKSASKWQTQAYRLILTDYKNLAAIHKEIDMLYNVVSYNKRQKGKRLATAWFKING